MALDRALEPPVPAGAVSGARGGRPPIGDLEASLGHVFADKSWLKRALTHVSALGAGKRGHTYERLEFLGDRVLGLALAELLFARFPEAEEGEMSRRFAELARKETCAEAARAWNVGPHLHLGPSEMRSGGRDKTAILGDACEALIAAVFLDAGYAAAQDLVARGFGGRIADPGPPHVDPKSELQEWAQARGLPVPDYRETARSGPDHKPEFIIRVEVRGYQSCEARGASKRSAEQGAARAFMEREGAPGALRETGNGAAA